MSTPQTWTGPEVLPAAGPPLVDLRTGIQPLSALSIVESAGADLGQQLVAVGALEPARDRLIRAGSGLWGAAHDELTQLARGFLHVDVGAVLLGGLLKARELVEAGRTTRGNVDSVLVDLAGHLMTVSRQPSVDVVLLRKVVATIPFGVRIDLTVKALTGTVRDGALAVLSSGGVDAVVTLSCCGADLAAVPHTFDPRLHVSLGGGVPIPLAG